jgi:hypothetical protein
MSKRKVGGLLLLAGAPPDGLSPLLALRALPVLVRFPGGKFFFSGCLPCVIQTKAVRLPSSYLLCVCAVAAIIL